ncbi:MBL fold metallo-hydrolase [Carnobacterium gallinarum]|uniref:MBL fold metallo-hydrolase n=1 Tax=Carnobacterium gallinarum TaxID=2749 RepID=UPI0005569B92|nr:MBL fold metallo-hydrolase [Carnobacterium gallinarum]
MSQIKTSIVDTGLYVLKEKLRKDQHLKPTNQLPSETIDVKRLDLSQDQVFWLGHSASLIIFNQKVILVDPMLGEYASPIPFMYKRFATQRPLDLAEFEWIDVVLFTHNHYDHLDKTSVLKIKNKVGLFLVSVGMKKILTRWGVSDKHIQEMDWHQDLQLGNMKIIATPAKHGSGRGLFDRNKSQCNSWILKDSNTALFLSGDSGYDQHFKEIGEKYGPFDLALMECGQYNPHWKEAHMFPEETVEAVLDVKAQRFIPIHWAGFALSFHPWQEPVEKASKKAQELNLAMDTPMIGEQYRINQPNATRKWWRTIDK